MVDLSIIENAILSFLANKKRFFYLDKRRYI